MDGTSQSQAVITGAAVRAWLVKAAEVLAENRAYLTELDSPIGDADHGNNMDRGFKAIVERLPDGDDIGALLKAAAMALISKVGGAAGPLYGSLFLDASKALVGKPEMSGTDLVQLLEDGIGAVKKRGRSDVGMKTMLDTLVPASNALRDHLENGDTLPTALTQACEAAQQGMEGTIPMQAQRGRASYLGERSIGHQDPGATSSYLILQALVDTVGEAKK